MQRLFIIFFLCLTTSLLWGQHKHSYYNHLQFSESDTLRGMLRPERTCFDVTFYDLSIKVDIEKRQIDGYVDMAFEVMDPTEKIQIDLFKNMSIYQIEMDGEKLSYDRVHNAVFVHLPFLKQGTNKTMRIHYGGTPIAARNAPWDGGFSWKEDKNDRPWVGVSCEGIGASLWWPNKDHLSDEPDSMAINIAVPNGLTCIANGNLRGKQTLKDDYTEYNWFVSYPINNYNVTLNIADYTHFSDSYEAADGEALSLDYYVLTYNLEKAKEHFAMVPEMMACYEHFFGKYPFWNDGFALVETPYLGMEHQGAIAYGNRYMRGYLGRMIPDDMDWDYIIVHETGHEYWGNSISCVDHAEMWIHESFTTYMEALYVECAYNYEDAIRYLEMQKPFITNKTPIVGPLNVNFDNWGHSDHYFKGSWVLHTLRHAIGDDDLWFDILKSFYQKHAISTIESADFINYVNEKTGRDFSTFFEQYLYHAAIPSLVYDLKTKGEDVEISCKWESDVDGFDMSIQVGKNGSYQTIQPTQKKQTFLVKEVSIDEFTIAEELFYIKTKQSK